MLLLVTRGLRFLFGCGLRFRFPYALFSNSKEPEGFPLVACGLVSWLPGVWFPLTFCFGPYSKKKALELLPIACGSVFLVVCGLGFRFPFGSFLKFKGSQGLLPWSPKAWGSWSPLARVSGFRSLGFFIQKVTRALPWSSVVIAASDGLNSWSPVAWFPVFVCFVL